MDKLKNLLEALDPGPLEVKEDAEAERAASNVLHLKFPRNDRGAMFTAAERERIRDMLDAFETIKRTCPIAARAAKT